MTGQRVLLPLVFCRECGQEYYCVRRNRRAGYGLRCLTYPVISLTVAATREPRAGYLHFSQENPWPSGDLESLIDRLPDDWIEEHRGQPRVKRTREDALPQPVRVNPDRLASRRGTGWPFHGRPVPLLPSVRRGLQRPADFRLRQTHRPGIGRAKHGDDDPQSVGRPTPAGLGAGSRSATSSSASPTTARTPRFRLATSTISLRSACFEGRSTRRCKAAAALRFAARRLDPAGVRPTQSARRNILQQPDRTVPGAGQYPAGDAERAGIPPVPRLETRVARHIAEPGAVRPLGDPVRVAR